MKMPEDAGASPLSDDILVFDVADAVRQGIGMTGDVAPDATDALLGKLRSHYAQFGLNPDEAVLREGVRANAENRFGHAKRSGLGACPARLYVTRRIWGPPVFALALALIVGLGAYFFGYRPYRASEAQQAQVDLTQTLPAQMDELYQQIFNETKVQTAASDAQQLRDRGKAAAADGNRIAAEQAVRDLADLRDRLQQTYTLRVVDHDGIKPGFWSFPQANADETNYYLVVEAIGPDGSALSLPITSEDTGLTQTVSKWGLRVPQSIYEGIMADKTDDGTIEHNVVGLKEDGFPDVNYAIPVAGGMVTQW